MRAATAVQQWTRHALTSAAYKGRLRLYSRLMRLLSLVVVVVVLLMLRCQSVITARLSQRQQRCGRFLCRCCL
jgi:hypothetical protein